MESIWVAGRGRQGKCDGRACDICVTFPLPQYTGILLFQDVSRAELCPGIRRRSFA